MMEQHQPKPSPSHTAPISEASVTTAVVKSSEEEHSEIVVAPTPIISSDGGGEPTSPIFHVLLLPGGNIQKLDSDGDSNRDSTSGKGGPAVIIDDFLYQRHVYRRKKLKKLQPQNIHQRGGNSDNNHNNIGSSSDDDDGGISLKVLASPLEIALASCCVRPNKSAQSAEEGGGQNQQQNEGTAQQQQQQTQRSRLHRPILPSNADDDDDNNELLDTPRNIPMRDTTTTDHDNNKKDGGEVGTLQHGKETHFLKLLQMYCHSTKDLLMCRALAVQILQRTVDWEKTCSGSGSSNTATAVSSGEGEEKQPNDDHRVADDSSAAADEPPANVRSSTTSKQRRNHTVMKTFLAIGGMKLLARWLVESYTVLHPQSSPTSSNKKKQQQQNPNTAAVLPSATGTLLLPLLTLLKSIPFNKELIVASQIHKYIKRYKKALMTVMSSNKSMMMSDVDGVEIVHPIAGEGSVNQVMNAVDEVMNEWNNATKNSSKDDDNDNDDDDENKDNKMIDPYKSLRDQLQSRFDELAAFHNHRTNPPEWIPKAVLGVVMASPSPNLSPTSTTTSNNNSSAPAAAMKPNPALATKNNANNEWGTNRASASQIARERFLEGFRKQKEAVASSSSSGLTMPPEKRQQIANTTAGGDATTNSASSINKKVCWVDRPGRKGVSPQPLHIERVFVKEEEYLAGGDEVDDVDVEMFGEEEGANDEEGGGGEGLPIIRQQQQQDDTVTTGEGDVVMMETDAKEDDEVDSDLDDMF